jgi:hypothetical protein
MSADDVSAGERALGELIDAGHLTQADSLPALIALAASRFGGRDTQLLIVDHAQQALVPFPPAGSWEEDAQSLDGTVPGRAFRQVQIQDVQTADGTRMWIPVLDGVERLGVLGVTMAAPDALARRRLTQLAGLAAYLFAVKAATGDTLTRAARRRPMTLAAELQWSTLPPLTVATERIAMSAMLEPCYDIGGDSIDHAIDGAIAHFAIFDAQGHGLGASVMCNLAVAAYRNARRAGKPLEEMAAAIESAIAGEYDEGAFVTCLLAHVDVDDGALRWINAGHPPALLLRQGRVVKSLGAPSDRPLGLGFNTDVTVHAERLQPGDQILAYSDGVTEARDEHGRQFGVERLADFVIRADAAGEPIPETMRRLSRSVLEHNHGDMRDDATHLLVGWLTDQPSRIVTDELADTGA